MARLILPPRSKLESVVSFPHQLATAVRVYRRTPPRLRRAEPAMRIGATVAAVWFAVLYTCLAVYAQRTAASAMTTVGYGIAALLGPLGLGLFLTRRQRAGLGALGGMLVLGQVVTIASMMSAPT